MKTLLFLTAAVITSSIAHAGEPTSWACSAKTGLGGAQRTEVRVEKQGSTYSVYLTAHSSDTGKQWTLKDELVEENMDCKFSPTLRGPLYCSSATGSGWLSLRAEDIKVSGIDEETGADQVFRYTSVILSGTPKIMKHFDQSVLKFGATTCMRK